jgi:hypothetical protein
MHFKINIRISPSDFRNSFYFCQYSRKQMICEEMTVFMQVMSIILVLIRVVGTPFLFKIRTQHIAVIRYLINICNNYLRSNGVSYILIIIFPFLK